MKDKKRLYFIALIPPDALAENVTRIKNELAEKYNSQKALKAPPHITLQAPFHWQEELEERITSQLTAFASNQTPFEIVLEDFNHFRDHTIYIDIHENAQLLALHRNLQDFLVKELHFTDDLLRHRNLNPHMTVAYRDLRPRFNEAWEIFQNRKFNGSFIAKSMFLLKHDFTRWQYFTEIPFNIG